jgi:hypothetical protein
MGEVSDIQGSYLTPLPDFETHSPFAGPDWFDLPLLRIATNYTAKPPSECGWFIVLVFAAFSTSPIEPSEQPGFERLRRPTFCVFCRHYWRMVVSHPYYGVTDESGDFEFTDVPPGTYQLVAWHEGWNLLGKEHAYDVLTQHSIERPLFSEPRTWEKSVTVSGNQMSTVDFVISNK